MIINNNKLITANSRMKSYDNFDPITIAYISGMTQKPDYLHIRLIDKLVVTIKSIIQKADVIYLGNINNSNDSFRNLVKNSHHGTIQGSGLVFDSYWGFSNPSGTGYVNTNYNPSTQAVKYTLDDASIGVYMYGNNLASNTQYVMTAYQTDSYKTGIAIGTDGVLYSSFNDNNSDYYGVIPFYNGFIGAQRTSSSSKRVKNQNFADITFSKASTAKPNSNFLLCRYHSASSIYYNGGLNFTYIGASLTDTEFTLLNNAVNDYLIQCLFLKYGLNNWGVKMAKSYFLELHNFERYEAFEVYEFIKRHQSNYTYTPLELSVNSGAPGLTDWVDSNSDGLADNWLNTNCTCSIVTGNGFTGNAQRAVQLVNGNSHINCAGVSGLFVQTGKSYKLSFKYRAGKIFQVTNGYTINIPVNTGNAILFEVTFTVTDISAALRLGYSSIIDTDSWFEIDELTLKEVTESDTVTFNKCLNSGFGNDTDWINPTNGLAENWYSDLLTLDSPRSIVSGNGFKDNAQRIERARSNGHLYLYPVGLNVVTIGKSYTLYLKYRSNTPIALYNISGIKYSDIGLANTGNAIEVSVTFTANNTRLYIGALNVLVGSWFEIDEVCIIDNCNSQFYYNFFGPNGLNKQVCDWMMLFKAGGNLIANTWVKTGALLRWNQDGSVTNSNTMPAYTRGTNLGIVTVTSTDGWNGVTGIDIHQTYSSVNSFYGNCPNFFSTIKIGGNKSEFRGYYNRLRINYLNQSLSTLCSGINNYNLTFPGGVKFNLIDYVNGVYTANYFRIMGNKLAIWASLVGDVTGLNNQFIPIPTSSVLEFSNDSQIYGSLFNLVISNNTHYLYFNYTSITQGTSIWNKNIIDFRLDNCRLNTAAVDAQLAVINTYFAANTPIKNVTINLSGAMMGIPTGGANNTDLLGIVAKHTAAGFTATITVRTS